MTIPHLAHSHVLIFSFVAFGVTLNAQQAYLDADRSRESLTGADRVIIHGDSITQAGDHIADIQSRLFARGIGNHFINLGIGSETTTELTPDENAGHERAYQFAHTAISERFGRPLITVQNHGCNEDTLCRIKISINP